MTAEARRDGWYHTAGLAVRDEEGFLHGCVKEMIRTGGENVFPAEVEAARVAHPSIREAVVFGVPDPEWRESARPWFPRRPAASPTTTSSSTCRHGSRRTRSQGVMFVDLLPRTAATGRVQKPRESYFSRFGEAPPKETMELVRPPRSNPV